MTRILIIDDEKSILFALRQYFVAQNYVVDCAQTAEQALEYIAGYSYSLAIVDVELRGSNQTSDGINLAIFLRTHAPATPVIILTAVETAETRQRANDAGIESFLQKPARLSHIADVAVGLMGTRAAVSH